MKQIRIKMRKVATIVACLAVAIVFFASCEKENDGMEEIAEEFTIYIWGSDSWTPFAGKNSVTFAVSPGDIIDITDDGAEVAFYGLAEGYATITATSGSDIKKAKVHVRPMEGASFGLKAATIHYDHHNGDRSAFTFDEYGKKCRIDTWDADGEHGILIFDGVAKRYYAYGGDGWEDVTALVPWNDLWVVGVMEAYKYDDRAKVLQMAPGITKKPNQTIAGKNCQVVGGTIDGESFLLAGWGNIIFKAEGDDNTFEATSFTTTVSANAFTQTINIF